jgi:hypothetical protein
MRPYRHFTLFERERLQEMRRGQGIGVYFFNIAPWVLLCEVQRGRLYTSVRRCPLDTCCWTCPAYIRHFVRTERRKSIAAHSGRTAFLHESLTAKSLDREAILALTVKLFQLRLVFYSRLE